MNTTFYLPVLKSKLGEFEALSKLDDNTKKRVVPLFEITPIEWDNSTSEKPKTIEKHLLNFCKKMVTKWPSNDTFIDTHLINDKRPDGMSVIEYILKLLKQKSIIPIPVVHLNSLNSFLSELETIWNSYSLSEIGIRITIADLLNEELESQFTLILNKLSISSRSCHMIIDLQNADFKNTKDFSDGILQALDFFPRLNSWKTITICGGAFPATNLIKTGDCLIPRNDWLLYREIIKKLELQSSKLKINYGDYGIVAPGYFEFDPLKMSRSANIRYTFNENWYIIKGKALKTSEDYQQYILQASQIVNSKYFSGDTFSAGDEHLKKCADRQTSTGNPTTWNFVGNNHHFVKVVADLAAIHSDF